MPDQNTIGLLQFLSSTYGPMNLLLLMACAYFGWALYNEQLRHQKTRDQIASVQEQAVKTQLQFVQVLSELKTMIEAKVKG